MTIVCLGEALVDMICERPLERVEDADTFTAHPGGALANVAVAASRAGGDAAIFGGVGDDHWGRWLRERLVEAGVHTGWMATTAQAPTPIAIVTFDAEREPAFSVYGEGISATMGAASRFLEEAMAEATALVFGSNTLVGDTERALTMRARRLALDAGVPILFDPNLRPNRWQDLDRAVAFSRELCDGTHTVRCNLDEARHMTGFGDAAGAAGALCALGARLGVVTLGADGAVMRGAASAEASAEEVEVVAPVGAGDAFMGALAAGLAAVDWEPSRAPEALPGAIAAGARACTGWSAQT